MKLERRYVEKPWGRTDLPGMFDAPRGERIGEIWFTGAGEQPLLAKYLFTSEPLSIQVHPDDEQARARGLPKGKSECWYIVEAEPGASIGLGLVRHLSASELRSAADDGSIEKMVAWRPVRAGDFFIVPSGTVHAIGAGISLIEFQQNADVTYRLYDYGRARELRLDDAIAVARREPYPEERARRVNASEESILVDGPDFVLIHCSRDVMADRKRWVMPLRGAARSNGDHARPGECLLVDAGAAVIVEGRALIAATA